LKTRLKAASNGKQLKMEWVKELLSIRRWTVLLHSQLLRSAVLADWQGFWGKLSEDAASCWFFST